MFINYHDPSRSNTYRIILSNIPIWFQSDIMKLLCKKNPCFSTVYYVFCSLLLGQIVTCVFYVRYVKLRFKGRVMTTELIKTIIHTRLYSDTWPFHISGFLSLKYFLFIWIYHLNHTSVSWRYLKKRNKYVLLDFHQKKKCHGFIYKFIVKNKQLLYR